jgi:hypothetical protein
MSQLYISIYIYDKYVKLHITALRALLNNTGWASYHDPIQIFFSQLPKGSLGPPPGSATGETRRQKPRFLLHKCAKTYLQQCRISNIFGRSSTKSPLNGAGVRMGRGLVGRRVRSEKRVRRGNGRRRARRGEMGKERAWVSGM